MYLTSEILKAKGACASQVNFFERLYPKGTEITLEECLKHAIVFDWDWAARYLLSPALRDTYYAQVNELWDTFITKRDWDTLNTHRATLFFSLLEKLDEDRGVRDLLG